MPDLFNNETTANNRKRNPYHANNGKFTSKDNSRAERAEQCALYAKNRVEYLESMNRGVAAQLRQKDEKIIELENKLKQLTN